MIYIQLMNSLRNLDLNLLVIFEAIYTAENISKAAKHLGVSQPTISNALTRLRNSLDDKLFIRAGRGVTPTPKAAQIIIPVRQALKMIQVGINEDSVFDPVLIQRDFRLIVAEPLEPLLLPTLINDLPQGHKISFDYFSPMAQDIEKSLMTGTSELAIFLLPTKNAEFRSEQLCQIDLVGVARKGHPRMDATTKLTKQTLTVERHVTLNLQPGKLRNTEKFSILQSPIRQTTCRVSSVGAIARIAGRTDLLGMIPRLFAPYAAKAYGLNIFELPIVMNKQHMFMIWHKRNDADSGHIWLRERIKTIVAAALST